MNETLSSRYTKLTESFREYGKVTMFVSCVFVSMLLAVEIISLNISGKLRVSFLDIGQGDSILIQTPSGKKMIVDGGPSNIVLTRLADQMPYFDTTVDVMEGTHPDADHVTGLIPILEKYKVQTILATKGIGHTQVFDDLNKHIDDEHADVHIAQTGDSLDFHDGVIVRVLYPSANYSAKKNDTNDASISVLVTYGNESFLLTGDLPSTEESKLISTGLPKNITVYKAGHHGSRFSSGEQLLTYIRPEYSIISAGKDNTYGHPNPEALMRLEKYSKEIVSTIDRGTITFVTDGKTIAMETDK